MEQTPRKKTILVVDDEPEILSVVSEVLADAEYNILTARTGSMGLQRSREFKGEIDLLLSDFQMPGGMSGVELATAMTIERPRTQSSADVRLSRRNAGAQRRMAFSRQAVYQFTTPGAGFRSRLSGNKIQVCKVV